MKKITYNDYKKFFCELVKIAFIEKNQIYFVEKLK